MELLLFQVCHLNNCKSRGFDRFKETFSIYKNKAPGIGPGAIDIIAYELIYLFMAFLA